MYIYGNISLDSSWNEKCFRQNCSENQNTHFIFNRFNPKIGAYKIMWKTPERIIAKAAQTLPYTYMACLMIIANLPIKSPKIQKPEATFLAYPSLLLAAIPVAAVMIYSRQLSH